MRLDDTATRNSHAKLSIMRSSCDYGTTPGRGILPTSLRSPLGAVRPRITLHKDVGVVDMRQIAPAIVKEPGVTLPTAKLPPLACDKREAYRRGYRVECFERGLEQWKLSRRWGSTTLTRR